MPVVGESIVAGILAHGRNGDAVAERHAANGQRRKQAHAGLANCSQRIRAKSTTWLTRIRICRAAVSSTTIPWSSNVFGLFVPGAVLIATPIGVGQPRRACTIERS